MQNVIVQIDHSAFIASNQKPMPHFQLLARAESLTLANHIQLDCLRLRQQQECEISAIEPYSPETINEKNHKHFCSIIASISKKMGEKN